MVKIIFPDIDLDGVEGVLIDLDDTLYSYEEAHVAAMIKCHQLFKTEIDPAFSSLQFDQDYRHYREDVTDFLSPLASCRSRLLAFQLWFEAIKVSHPYSKALQFENHYWEHLIDAMTPCEKAIDFLKECHLKNLPVCIVSDLTAQQQMKKIKKLNIEEYISALVTSEESGVEKPDPRIFKLALDKIQTTPNKTIMIGDHPVKDIASAQALGLKAYRVYSEH